MLTTGARREFFLRSIFPGTERETGLVEVPLGRTDNEKRTTTVPLKRLPRHGEVR